MSELDKYTQYLPIFLVAFISSFLLTPIIGYFAKKLQIIDLPAALRKKGERGITTRIHKEPTAKLGGLAVVIPFSIIAIALLPFSKELFGVVLGVIILTIGGVLDDKYELPGKAQLMFQLIAAFIIVLSGTGIEYIRNPFGGEINMQLWQIPFMINGIAYHFSLPSDLITIAWIILVINAMNWTAGIDGLIEGITGISAIIITLLSIRFFTHPTAVMGAALAGGVLGFLPFNFNPAKIFSGSIGDYVYGFLLATLSIYSGAKFATAIMLLGIPIIDALWVLYNRVKKQKGKTLSALMSISDQSHLHHRLLDMGLTVKQIDYIEYSLVGILGMIAFLFTGLLKAFALFLSLVLITIFIIYTSQKVKKESVVRRPKELNEESPEKKFAY